jgi:hypothetical protein
MTTLHLPDEHQAKVHAFLRNDPQTCIGNALNCPRFAEAVLWVDRSGAQRRLLPETYGNRNSIYEVLRAGVNMGCGNACWRVVSTILT